MSNFKAIETTWYSCKECMPPHNYESVIFRYRYWGEEEEEGEICISYCEGFISENGKVCFRNLFDESLSGYENSKLKDVTHWCYQPDFKE